MEKFNLNIRNIIGLHRIFQGKFVHYFNHMNYKLEGRYVCIRNMYLQDDSELILAKLVAVNTLEDVLQFHLQFDGIPSTELVTLKPDDVLILFNSNKDETEFMSEFIYWDDKHVTQPGFNIKSLINVSRLDKFSLKKCLDHPNYKLNGRSSLIRSMDISSVDHNVLGHFVGMPDYGKHPTVMVNYGDGFMSSQKHIGLEEDGTDNGLVLLIFDKDGINPEFIYWED